MPQNRGQGRGLEDFFAVRLERPECSGKKRARRDRNTMRMAVRFCGMNAALLLRHLHPSGLEFCGFSFD